MIELININRMHTIHKANVAMLSSVNLEFSKNELCCIVGKTKSGKTTLLNILALSERPSSGKVIVDGKDVDSFSEKDKNKYRRSYVSRITQFDDLIPELTVFENCYIATDPEVKIPEGKRATDDVFRALDAVGLSGYENRRVKELNPAEKKRLSIARAISQNVKVLLCDEPTWNLDPESGREIMKLLVAISSSVCVIVATNNIERAEKYADRIIDLGGGMVISDKGNEPTQSNDGFKITLPLVGEPFTDKSRYNKKCTRNAYFKIVRGVMLKRWGTTILVCALIITLISALFCMSSLSLYDYSSAVAATCIDNDVYFMPLEKNTPSGVTQSNEETRAAILASHPNAKLADAYVSSDSLIVSGNTETCFVVVEDFSSLSLPLIRGSYPDAPNKILVSVSTAKKILESGYFKNVRIIEGIIGRKIQLKENGISFIVSGIYESDEPGLESYEDEYGSATAEMQVYYDLLHQVVYVTSGLPEYAKEHNTELEYSGIGVLLCGGLEEISGTLRSFLPGTSSSQSEGSYIVNSPIEKSIREMDKFLTATAKSCRYFRVVLLLFHLLGLSIYILVAARKHMKNLGILRMIGKSSGLLMIENALLSVGFETFGICVGTLCGKYFIFVSNRSFSYGTGSVLSLFHLSGVTQWTAMIAMIAISVLSSTMLYFIIKTRNPIDMISDT